MQNNELKALVFKFEMVIFPLDHMLEYKLPLLDSVSLYRFVLPTKVQINTATVLLTLCIYAKSAKELL